MFSFLGAGPYTIKTRKMSGKIHHGVGHPVICCGSSNSNPELRYARVHFGMVGLVRLLL